MSDQDQPLDDATKVVPTAPNPTTQDEIAPPLTPAPVTPVSATTTGPKPSRGRWAVAIAAAAVIVAITAGLVVALVGRSPDAVVMGYVPGGTVAYGEVRLDLPGDQRQAVGEFLSHFPGFADQSTLDNKLDEVLDDLVKDASDGKQTFTKDIQPWFGGELAVSAGPLPTPSSISSSKKPDISNALALISIKDPTAAKAWFDAEFAKHGGTPTTQDYNGTTLTVFGGSDGPQLSFAIIDGKVAVAGPIGSVKAAVDTGGKGEFAADPNVRKALGSASGDHVGFAYVALDPILDWVDSLAASLPNAGSSDAPSKALGATMRQFVPAWSAYWLRFQKDAVVMEATGAKPATVLGPTTDRSSAIAKHVPASTLVLGVSHDTGKTLQQVLDLYQGDASLKGVTDKVEQGLGALGGADNALGWIGDTGLVVNDANGSVEGGLVILPTDAKAAASFFTSIQNLASLSGAAGVTFSEQAHGGTTIHVATIDLAGLAGGAPAQAFKMPIDKVELAWAVTDELVVIGSGPSFVGHVLDTTEATSLAGTARYQDLMGRVGDGTHSLFVDIAGARGFIEDLAKRTDAGSLKDYDTNLKPFLAPLDALVASSSVGGDVTRSTLIITVK